MTKHKNVALDELRILAALMVLGVHTGQKVGLGDAAAVGAQGVQLFFVLSGYLAAASLSRHPEPLPYYQRRIRRILPLYWLVLVLRWLFDAVRYLAAGASAAQLFGPGGPCGPGYLRYFVFLQMWLPSDNWMLWNNRNVLWTMSAFAFFYLLAPWLYRLCKRFWGALALLVVCLAVKGRIGGLIESSLAAFPAEANISEFSAKTPVMTLYCFIFGMAAFAAVRENKQFLYGAFCILLAVVVGSVVFYRPFCKWLCPLGAVYALMNHVSLFQMRVDRDTCVSCGACAKACPMDVDITKTPNHAECIRCGKCIKSCPTKAICYQYGFGDKSKTEIKEN